MKLNLFQFASATLFFTFVFASPVPVDIGLDGALNGALDSMIAGLLPQANGDCPIKEMSISHCSSCFSIGDGFPQCRNDPYIHFGGSGERDCQDMQAPINDDFCSAFGTIPTPYGQGTWTSQDGCGTTGDPGHHVGDIAGDGFTCACIRDRRQNNMWCGINYTCSQYYQCFCASEKC